MARSTRAVLAFALVVFACASLFGCGGGGGKRGKLTLDDMKLEASDLGVGWRLSEVVEVDIGHAQPGSSLEMLKGLGAEKIVNKFFARDGERIQVNLILFPNKGDAVDAVKMLLIEIPSNVYGYNENIAVELISNSPALKKKVFKLLKLKDTGTSLKKPGSTNRISFKIACVDSIDYMKANQLMVYLENYTEGSEVDPGMQAVINSATFGNRLKLLTMSGGNLRTDYALTPEPVEKQEGGGSTTYVFDAGKLPKKLGVPYVTVEGELTVGTSDLEKGDGTSLDANEKGPYLEATPFWPAADNEVKGLANQVAGPTSTDAEKVQALWKWVRENVKYSGPMGTRYGTRQVLSQRYGRCWDSSDVFVTLCRAAGVPARQVAGWLKDAGSGHVWSQAYIGGRGWVSVDATGDHVGSDDDYLPFFATADGAMPIVYVRMPTVGER